MDRADVRDALAYLEQTRGFPDEARALLEAAVSDLRSLPAGAIGHLLADRLESLAEAFRRLGDIKRSEEIARLASGAAERRPRDFPGGHRGEDF